MAWLELHQAIRDHRKIVIAADALNLPEPHVVGHLAYLWLWSLDNAPDGKLPSARVIARAAWWAGDADAFVAALVAAELLDVSGDDLHIHDWDEYAGKLIDRRASNRERQARHRDKSRHIQSHNGDVTVTSPSRNGATEQNTTVQNSKGANAPPSADADEHATGDESKPLYSEDFETFWRQYPRGRGDKGDAFKVWKRLSRADRAAATEAIPAWTACDDWQRGFFPASSRWLRNRGWEDEPPAPRRATVTPIRGPNGKPNGQQRIAARDNYVPGQFETKDKGGWANDDGTMKAWHEL